MKTSIVLACLLSFNFSFCQTKIIANKSHSGNAVSLAAEKDGNFGIAPERLDSVIKISDTSVVEVNNFGWRDTVYNHPYFLKPGITIDQLKEENPHIIFVGFEKKHTKMKKPAKSKENKGSLYLLALLMAGSLIYTFKQKKRAV